MPAKTSTKLAVGPRPPRKVPVRKLLLFLNYGGNCAQAFRFYEAHLGGKITMMMTQGEVPDASQVPPERRDDILHARMNIGGTELIASDVSPGHFQPMRSAYLYLSVDSVAEAERVYALLSDGGQVFMPLAETFFAHRFAMLRDKFGTSWALIYERSPA
jgi:PhnB protein